MFFLAIHSYLYSFVLRFLFSSNSRNLLQFLLFPQLLYTVKEKGGKPDRKPYPLPLKMNTALEYSTRVVQEGGRRCKMSTLNDLVHLTPPRIPLMNPPLVLLYTQTHTIIPLYTQTLHSVQHNHPTLFYCERRHSTTIPPCRTLNADTAQPSHLVVL